jgi:hypothetical protein
MFTIIVALGDNLLKMLQQLTFSRFTWKEDKHPNNNNNNNNNIKSGEKGHAQKMLMACILQNTNACCKVVTFSKRV